MPRKYRVMLFGATVLLIAVYFFCWIVLGAIGNLKPVTITEYIYKIKLVQVEKVE